MHYLSVPWVKLGNFLVANVLKWNNEPNLSPILHYHLYYSVLFLWACHMWSARASCLGWWIPCKEDTGLRGCDCRAPDCTPCCACVFFLQNPRFHCRNWRALTERLRDKVGRNVGQKLQLGLLLRWLFSAHVSSLGWRLLKCDRKRWQPFSSNACSACFAWPADCQTASG